MKTWSEHLDAFVGRGIKFNPARDESGSESGIIGSDIGRNVGFNRIAVHHITIESGHCSSLPHAESLEEEFVFVIEGFPSLWLNGWIHPLKPGHAVGFPAGTGIAHNFINNTSSRIRLLVAGDRNKKENLCSFPVNPEMKEKSTIWWENAPSHPLGPHTGKVGPVQESELGKDQPSCLVYCPDVEKQKPFHYPGDSETFGVGFRITNRIGLKNLGISFDRLLPGSRTAFPHAHTHEEEFVYIIKGQPTLWVDGFTKILQPDEFAAFPSNTGHSHTLINNTEDEVHYLCIGETADFPDEKILYPLHPLRYRECVRKNWAWLNPPAVPWGKESAQPLSPPKGHLAFRIASEKDTAEVFDIFKSSPDYFLKVEGCLPSLETARLALLDTPKNKHHLYDKQFLIIEQDNESIGAIDLHIHHREEKSCYIGVLLLRQDLHHKKIGTQVYQLLEHYIQKALTCEKIVLGVSAANNVDGFWTKMGFQKNGQKYEWPGEKKSSIVEEYEKTF